MAKTRRAYTPEFRQRMVELVHAGRSPEQLAKEFEPTAKSIREWVAQADRDEGRREDGLTSAEREELVRLRRENKQLKLEREILSKAAARVSLGRRTRSHPRVPFREPEPGPLSGRCDVPRFGCLPQRLLRVERPPAVSAHTTGCDAHG